MLSVIGLCVPKLPKQIRCSVQQTCERERLVTFKKQLCGGKYILMMTVSLLYLFMNSWGWSIASRVNSRDDKQKLRNAEI